MNELGQLKKKYILTSRHLIVVMTMSDESKTKNKQAKKYNEVTCILYFSFFFSGL